MVRDNKLVIFENFEVDNNLPKHNKEAVKVELTGSLPSSGSIIISNQVFTTPISLASGTGTNWIDTWRDDNREIVRPVAENTGFFAKLFSKFKFKKEEKKVTMTIVQFFSSLANSLNEMKSLQDVGLHYETLITNAVKGGQTALAEQLKSRLESAKSESQLVAFGLKQYLLEGQIVDFYNKTNKDKKLKLTWIKNFVKPIPTKIMHEKAILDEQGVFDNYVVLHYDPFNDATNLTEFEKKQEEIRKKDPILFGLIKGSRRLYYVGDWIDKAYCDLTLDQVIDTLEEDVNELNNDTVKTYLERGTRIDTRTKWPEPVVIPTVSPEKLKEIKTLVQKVMEKSKALAKKVAPKKKIAPKKKK